MTEREIQFRLYRWRSGQHHRYIVPNSEAYGYDADLISLTNRGYSIEHEIKCSRADFLSEIRAMDVDVAKSARSRTKYWKHDAFRYSMAGKPFARRVPNYFTFVVPAELVRHAEVPSYAGLIWYFPDMGNDPKCFYEIKRPVLLHKREVEQDVKDKLARSLEFRFWNTRATEYGVDIGR